MLKFVVKKSSSNKKKKILTKEEVKKKLTSLLKNVFGFDRFRKHQLDIVTSVVNQNDVFVVMSTGFGKSLLYQLPSLYYERGITVVISPLISLMKDQVNFLKGKKIKCSIWSSYEKKSELRALERDLSYGYPSIKMLFTTPESISSSKLKNCINVLVKRKQINLFAIDEAHCISSWGHDFRPKYLKLVNLRAHYPRVPIIALTATATTKVKTDILNTLKLRNPRVFQTSFNRSEISYEIRYKDILREGTNENLAKFLGEGNRRREFGIIYCRTRRNVDSMVEYLKERNFKQVAGYHAGMKKKDREKAQKKWMNNKIKILVATVAFGMGIDKPDIRFVVHMCVPQSIEGFYQESGRAGRDKRPSISLMYYSVSDKSTINYLIGVDKSTSMERKQNIKGNFEKIVYLCETATCRRKFILNYFGEKFDETRCKNTCDFCKSPVKVKEDIVKACTAAHQYSKAVKLFTKFNVNEYNGVQKFYDGDSSMEEDNGNVSDDEFRRKVTRNSHSKVVTTGRPLGSILDDLEEEEKDQGEKKEGFIRASNFGKVFRPKKRKRGMFEKVQNKRRKITKGNFSK